MEERYRAVHRALEAVPLTPDAGDPVEKPLRIRRAYADPVPPPPEPEGDVLYYHLEPGTGPGWTEESRREDGGPAFFRFAAWRLILVFYGPRAAELAERFAAMLFLDGRGRPRGILRAAGIYVLPGPRGPMLSWEEWQVRHRPRVDLELELRIRSRVEAPPLDPELAEVPPEIRPELCP